MAIQQNNLVTTIIPLYNADKYIARALDSVYSQTYQEFEIIIVDDGSTDRGCEICRDYSQKKGKLKLFEQKNSGPGTARNHGLEKAKGEFIFFLDADDYIDPNTLEASVNALHSSSSDLVIVEEMIVNVNNECSPNPYLGLPNEIVNESTDDYFCSKDNYIKLLTNFREYRNPARKIFYSCKGRLLKSKIIKENSIAFPDNIFFMEDLIFQMQYCVSAKSLTLLKKPYYFYQLHNSPNSITSRFASDKYLTATHLQYETTVSLLTNDNFCSQNEAEKSASYAIIDDMIVNAICSSRFINRKNYKGHYKNLKRVIKAPLIQYLLKYYVPLPEQSKLILFLMKIKAIHWLLYILKKKGANRYKMQEKKL